MSAISTILARLRSAIWAIDVRDDIADAIEQCYSDVSNPTLQTEALEAAIQEKIDEGEMAALTIGDGTITAAKLAANAVTTPKIADGSITQAKLDPNIDFVQVDDTLSQTGEAADAAAVGAAIDELNGSLDSMVNDAFIINSANYAFEQGSINVSNGSNIISPNGIRTTDFIDENKEIVKFTCPPNYVFRVYAWYKSNGLYAGCLQNDGTVVSSGTVPTFTSLKVKWDIGYKYKICIHNKITTDAILPSAGENLSVVFYTDSTLTKSTKAADAKAVGDALKAIDDSMAIDLSTLLTFEQGQINPTTAALITTPNGIRTTNFITKGTGIDRLHCSSEYRIRVLAWDESDVYIGCPQPDGTIITSGTFPVFTDFALDWQSGYKYKVTMTSAITTPPTAILPSEGAACVATSFTDKTLTIKGKAADAKAVGDLLNNVYTQVGLPGFEQGGIRVNSETGELVDTPRTIRSSDFIYNSSGITKITSSDETYCFRVCVYDKDTDTYLGIVHSDGTVSNTEPYDILNDISLDSNPNYKYKLAGFRKDISVSILPSEGSHYVAKAFTEHKIVSDLLESVGININNNSQMSYYACDPTFVGTPDTIFDVNDAITGIDDCRYNYLNVVKISESMYYMYYEAFSISDGAVDYPGSRTCFAYSTDGLNFTKGFPQGITPPGYEGNMILPKGSVTGQFVCLVPDSDYPFRMVGTQGTNPNRITKMWKSTDGVNWTYVRQITAGYNDCPASVVVRGNTLKMYLRTRNGYGRAIGMLCTDLDGNRLSPNWMQVISMNDFNRQFYTSAASAIDDRRELLLPTLYNPADWSESACALIVDGSKVSYKDMDISQLCTDGENSFYIGPGIINIGLDSYIYYVVHYALHDDASTPGQTRSAIRRIKITDTTFQSLVPPHDNQGN